MSVAVSDDFGGPVWIPQLPPSFANYLVPHLQPLPLIPAIAVLLAMAYLAGAVRMWVSGRGWPIWQALLFLTGCALLAATMGLAVEGYGYELFSVFMFQQLTLMIAVPPLLILGRPGTLLLRATPHRGPGRYLLIAALWGLRSGVGRALIHPALTIPVFLFSFYGLYLGDLASPLLSTWAGHLALEVGFLAAGIVFTVPVLSRDPLPRTQGHVARAMDVLAEVALQAFFGVIVMTAGTAMVTAFTHPPSSWGVDVLGDQGVAGALAWSYGEPQSLLLLLIIMARWYRDETRATAAADRETDRYGNRELDAYNAYLRRLGGAPPSGGPPTD